MVSYQKAGDLADETASRERDKKNIYINNTRYKRNYYEFIIYIVTLF